MRSSANIHIDGAPFGRILLMRNSPCHKLSGSLADTLNPIREILMADCLKDSIEPAHRHIGTVLMGSPLGPKLAGVFLFLFEKQTHNNIMKTYFVDDF